MSRCLKAAFAGSNADLHLHDIDAADHLGDRMLHLDARVHLDEVKFAVLVEELERARAFVADLAARVGAALADAGAARGLIAVRALPRSSSDAAAASSNRDRPARRRCDDDRRAPGSRCGAGARETAPCRPSGCRMPRAPRCASSTPHWQRRLGMHHTHAASAATAGGFDDHGIADVARDLLISSGASGNAAS